VLYVVSLHIWRTNHVVKILGAALLLASGLAITAAPQALALQAVVTQVDKSADGTATYHFAIKTDPGETLTPGESPYGRDSRIRLPPWVFDGERLGDFVTVYNFYGLIDESVKSPAGWEFSSEESGRTPTSNGYPMVLPLDVPNTPNLTWTVTKPVAGGAQIEGFTATTHVSTMVQGEYTAQVTRQLPAIAGASGVGTKASKQALIGAISTPSFLAPNK
jgi:hypothetical protein